MTPTARREAVGYLQAAYAFSQRRACQAIRAHRAAIRYQRRVRGDEQRIRERLRALAAQRPRWGYRRLHVLLKRELGVVVNRRARLSTLPPGRLGDSPSATQAHRTQRACSADRGWTTPRDLGDGFYAGFMQDVLDGRRFRTLNILDTVTDTVTRECLAIEVDTSFPGERVVRTLDRLIEWHGIPKRVTLDNGPEFADQTLDAWAYRHGVQLDFIDPGKPMQNGYMESFNGHFRDECLNQHGFTACRRRDRSSPLGERSTIPSDRMAR